MFDKILQCCLVEMGRPMGLPAFLRPIEKITYLLNLFFQAATHITLG